MQVSMQIALLERKSLVELQALWQKYFDVKPFSLNKEFYVSRIAYKIQELAYGGLSASQQKLIANMYIPPDYLRLTSRLPSTHTRTTCITISNDNF